MASKNDITLDTIQTGVPSKEYLNNYDLIFRKNKPSETVRLGDKDIPDVDSEGGQE